MMPQPIENYGLLYGLPTQYLVGSIPDASLISPTTSFEYDMGWRGRVYRARSSVMDTETNPDFGKWRRLPVVREWGKPTTGYVTFDKRPRSLFSGTVLELTLPPEITLFVTRDPARDEILDPWRLRSGQFDFEAMGEVADGLYIFGQSTTWFRWPYFQLARRGEEELYILQNDAPVRGWLTWWPRPDDDEY